MRRENYYKINIKEELVLVRISEEERLKNEEKWRVRRKDAERMRREYEEEDERKRREESL